MAKYKLDKLTGTIYFSEAYVKSVLSKWKKKDPQFLIVYRTPEGTIGNQAIAKTAAEAKSYEGKGVEIYKAKSKLEAAMTYFDVSSVIKNDIGYLIKREIGAALLLLYTKVVKSFPVPFHFFSRHWMEQGLYLHEGTYFPFLTIFNNDRKDQLGRELMDWMKLAIKNGK